MQTSVNTVAAFERYMWAWKLNGLKTQYNNWLIKFYGSIVIMISAIGFSLHLTAGTIFSTSMEEVFNCLVLNVAFCGVSIKLFVYCLHLKTIDNIFKGFSALDTQIKGLDEIKYHRLQIQKPTRFLTKFIYGLYHGIIFATMAAAVNTTERTLLFHGKFPFDWNNSLLVYIGALFYQVVACEYINLQNIAADGFGPLALCALAEHVELLAFRLKKVGYDVNKSEEQHNLDLNQCAKDFLELMRIRKLIERTISWSLFVQFIIGAFNICVVVACLTFFSGSPFLYMSNALTLLGVFTQMFPSCYYGSLLVKKFDDLPYAIFCCNWPERQVRFKRSVVILTQLSLKPVSIKAGRMFAITLATFFATVKMSYSLCCLVLNYE